MKKFRTKLGVAGILLSASLVSSCAQDMASAPATQQGAQSAALVGTWDYRSTDGYDLSDYGITYQFNGTAWSYTMPGEGTKNYEYATEGNQLRAKLVNNTFASDSSTETIGSAVDASYKVQRDVLTMTYDGHTGVLERHAEK